MGRLVACLGGAPQSQFPSDPPTQQGSPAPRGELPKVPGGGSPVPSQQHYLVPVGGSPASPGGIPSVQELLSSTPGGFLVLGGVPSLPWVGSPVSPSKAPQHPWGGGGGSPVPPVRLSSAPLRRLPSAPRIPHSPQQGSPFPPRGLQCPGKWGGVSPRAPPHLAALAGADAVVVARGLVAADEAGLVDAGRGGRRGRTGHHLLRAPALGLHGCGGGTKRGGGRSGSC